MPRMKSMVRACPPARECRSGRLVAAARGVSEQRSVSKDERWKAVYRFGSDCVASGRLVESEFERKP